MNSTRTMTTSKIKLLFCCFSILFTLSAQAQDIIIFNSGDTLECKIVGVNYAGVHVKTSEGRQIFEKETIESYRNNKNWVQVSGPASQNDAPRIDTKALDQIAARQKYEQSLNSAGNWLIAGVLVSSVLVGSSFLFDDPTNARPLVIAGAIALPVSTIIAGAKLKGASRSHELMELK